MTREDGEWPSCLTRVGENRQKTDDPRTLGRACFGSAYGDRTHFEQIVSLHDFGLILRGDAC